MHDCCGSPSPLAPCPVATAFASLAAVWARLSLSGQIDLFLGLVDMVSRFGDQEGFDDFARTFAAIFTNIFPKAGRQDDAVAILENDLIRGIALRVNPDLLAKCQRQAMKHVASVVFHLRVKL